LWEWTSELPFSPTSSGIYEYIDTTCTGDLIVPDFSSNDTTYCDTNIIPKVVSNGVPIDTSGGDVLPLP
jgi:hypothetical protein